LSAREPKRLSWWQLEDLVGRYTAVFHRARTAQGTDALVVQLPNLVDLPAIYLACARLGIIVSPAPVQYREHELAYICNSIDAKAVVTAKPHRQAGPTAICWWRVKQSAPDAANTSSCSATRVGRRHPD
jgi:acyl-CoA synthetase (AMP-forming)/AMP-acid ligase II